MNDQNPGLWRILLVDDDEDDSILVRSMLQEAQGRKVALDWAPSYRNGQEKLQTDHYDAVLVDYDLGLHTGIEFIRQTAARGYPAPLILYTGRGTYDVDLEAMQAGATLYLSKGEVNALLLERSIRYAIERKQVEEALASSNRRINEILSSITDDFYVLDRDWKFVYANKQFTGRINKEPEDFIGNSIWEMFPKHVGSILYENFQASMEKGEKRRFEVRGEYSDSWYSMTSFPSAEGITVLGTDITERKRAEEGLRMSKERQTEANASLAEERDRLRALLVSIPDEVWFCDAAGNVMAANPAAVRGLELEHAGEDFKAVPDWPALEILNPNGRPRPVEDAPLLRALRGEAVKGQEEIVRLPHSGELMYRQASGDAIRDAAGHVQGAVIVVRDVTEQKRAAEALRKSEEKYSRVFRSSPVAIAISTVTEGRFLEVNDSYSDLYGFSREELIGHTSIELGMFPNPEDRQKIARLFRQGGGFRNYEIRLLTKSGEPRDVLFSTEAVDIDGQECMLSLVVDFTERKQAEKALHENLNRLRRIFETSVIGIIERDVEGTILSVNDALMRMLGYRREDFQARSVSELLPEEYHPVEQEIVEEVLETGSSRPHEKEFIRKDGSRMPVLVGHTLLEGDPAEIIGFVVDLTELKQTQAALQEYTEKLARSNQELEQFAFVASHDLQEPLRKIRLFGNSLEQKLGGDLPRDARDTLTRMQKAAGRMQKMIDGLLELSRVNTRGGEFEAVPLTRVAQEAVSDLEARLRASRGQVEVGELPTAEVDVLLMRRLFQNLIGNALKFHKPEAPPVVRVAGKVVRSGGQQWAQITIADNGIGFDEANAGHLFQPFQRLHGRDQYEGTGMGLAICRKIVERHGGRIAAQSTPGQGSTFSVTLPLRQPVRDPGEAHG